MIRPRERHAGGERTAVFVPDLDHERAADLAAIVKALADPTRLRIVDAIRKADPEAICQIELLPLFEMSQPGLAKHLKVLVEGGILAAERHGAWTYYYLRADGLTALTQWLSHAPESSPLT